jgi:hypothetical protein
MASMLLGTDPGDKILTLVMKVGDVTYRIPASEAGDMTFSDNGATLNIRGRAYKVEDISSMGVSLEEPQPVTLVAINYRKGYEWHEPHNNIPLTYQYIVYRDSVFSDGSVHTSETRSGNTAMESAVFNTSYQGGNGQTIEDVRGITVYYFARQVELNDNAYRNYKISRKIAVPDISLVTVEKVERQDREPNQWESYQGYDANNPQVGWYWSDFAYANLAYLYYNYAGGGGKILRFHIYSRWYNHILYVEDGLNGGQLIDFLGDENDIDDVDYRAQPDFSITEEETTMPTGEPAKVFTHKCITTMLGRQFHYEIVDSVYQYDPEHPPF